MWRRPLEISEELLSPLASYLACGGIFIVAISAASTLHLLIDQAFFLSYLSL